MAKGYNAPKAARSGGNMMQQLAKLQEQMQQGTTWPMKSDRDAGGGVAAPQRRPARWK